MNWSLKIPSRQERLAEPPEEDLHPGLHEHALGAFAHPVELHEAVEQRDQRLLGGRVDRERTGLGLELLRLPLDLVAELRRQALEVGVPRRREGKDRRHAVLVLGLLDAEPRGGGGVAQEREPGVVLGEATQVGGGPVLPGQERRPELLRDRVLAPGERRPGPCSRSPRSRRGTAGSRRSARTRRRRSACRRPPRRTRTGGARAAPRTPPSRASGSRACGRTCPRDRPGRARPSHVDGSRVRPRRR